MRSLSLLVVLLVACGSGAGSGGNDAGVEVDASDASADASAADARPPERFGRSFVLATRGSSSFVEFREAAEGPGSCLLERVAGCRVSTCDSAMPEPPFPHAGEVTITSPDGIVVHSPDSDGNYARSSGQTPNWESGEAVSFQAAGGDVPPFDETLAGPAPLAEILEPDFTEDPVPVPRDEPFTARWSGGTGQVASAVLCNESDQTAVQVICEFPADAGEGSIPIEALARIPSECETAFVAVLTEDRRVIEPGSSFRIILAARGSEEIVAAALE